jgi:hypothetical protein
MLIGLFLLYLAAFAAVFYAIEWLSVFLANATVSDVVTFVAAASGATTALILARNGLNGITIAVAIMVFWSVMLFGADRATVATTLDIAALILVAAAAAALSEPILRRILNSRS